MATEKAKGIGERISAVMADVHGVEKTGENAAQRYKYVEVAEVIRAVRESMVKHGVLCIPRHEVVSTAEVQTRSGGIMSVVTTQGTFRYACADNLADYIENTALGCGSDAGDKAIPKAMTCSFKYSLMQLFLLQGGDDAEVDSHERAPAKPAGKPVSIAKPAAGKPAAAKPRPDAPAEGWETVTIKKAFAPATGTGKTGRPWTRFDAATTDGDKLTTFDTEAGALFVDGETIEVIADDADGYGKRKVHFARPAEGAPAAPAGDPWDDLDEMEAV